MSVRFVSRCVLVLVVAASGGATFAGDGVVALQTADPSCADDSGKRYVDCGNGTVTDNETGLVWLAKADCFVDRGQLTWQQAREIVVGFGDLECSPEPGDCDCGLSDGSSPGEWRLPSASEWKAMIETDDVGCSSPPITDDAGTGCWDQDCVDAGSCSFYGLQSSWYWSSPSFVPDPTFAWGAFLVGNGFVGLVLKDDTHYFWPVRDGQ